jgi:4-alpha-glucanotransferase
MKKRGSGILLHLTSLPSAFGIGDLGPAAYAFADFLVSSGQSFWQVLPLNPTDPARGNIPYASASAFAGNPLLVSPELLVEDHLLEKKDLADAPPFPEDSVDYESLIPWKKRILRRAFEHFKAGAWDRAGFDEFCGLHAAWLNDFALFSALKDFFDGKPWHLWPDELRRRQHDAMEKAGRDFSAGIEEAKFRQFLFFSQWSRLREQCNLRGIRIIGDIPIYVDYDSVDLWMNPGLFKLDENLAPTVVSGVPPDYFSDTGQLWGSPVYDWEALRASRYAWWVERFRQNFRLCDILRIDHFRGLVAYWEIPAGAETAMEGRWVKVPTDDLFHVLTGSFESFPVVAEDLGVITDDVREVIERLGFPGMKVLLFAFGGDAAENPYLPHNHVPGCVVYPGTHDNNTVRGWFENEASEKEKAGLLRYLGRRVDAKEAAMELVRMAMMSVARTAVISMQDLLGLGEEARLNRPATVEHNYCWRLRPGQVTPELAAQLLDLTRTYGRTRPDAG